MLCDRVSWLPGNKAKFITHYYNLRYILNQETNGLPGFLKCLCRVIPNICTRSTEVTLSASPAVLQGVPGILRSLLAHRGTLMKRQKTSFMVWNLERKWLQIGKTSLLWSEEQWAVSHSCLASEAKELCISEKRLPQHSPSHIDKSEQNLHWKQTETSSQRQTKNKALKSWN